MTIEIHVPDIGTDEVEVTEILVNIGDLIKEDQSLIIVEGDKASMEIPAPRAGIVKEISINLGDKISTGSLIMLFEEEKAPTQKNTASAKIKTQSSKANHEFKEVYVSDIGSDEVEVIEILVSVGEQIEFEQSLIAVEGDKASMEIPAPFAGKVQDIKIAVGDKVSTGSLIMIFETIVQAKAEMKKSQIMSGNFDPVVEVRIGNRKITPQKVQPLASEAPSTQAVLTETMPAQIENSEFETNDAYVHASPVVRRIAREFGINLAKIAGTGHKNRIQKADLQQYVKAALAKAESGSAVGNAGTQLDLLAWPKVDFAKFGEIEIQPLSRIKKSSGANLARNWAMIPHVTQFDHADITELEAFRQEQNALEAKKGSGVKITPLVFIIKAVAKALTEFPTFNSSLSEDRQDLILKKYTNIGVAVDTANGLVVPVFNSVNSKGIYQLSAELAAVSAKARAGKLMASDMQGGCFSISSLGGIGGSAFTPIINAPEVAILGVSKSQMKPVWNGKEFIPRLHLPLALSYDHRVIDGAEGARFITYLNQCLSDIRRLVL